MNINALKDRLQQLNRRTTKANDIWKPKDEHTVRCLPYPHGGDPMIDLHFHYEIGENAPILCPKANFGKDCSICDFCEKLRAWKDESGQDKAENDRKQDFEIFKKIQPKARVFIPMVERGKEAEGAKFWGVTPNQAQQILEVCTDGDRLSDLGIDQDDAAKAMDVIFSTDKAYDLKVSFAKPGEKGNNKSFTQVEIKGKIKASPLAANAAEASKILGSVKNIREVYPEVSSADVEKIFSRWLGSLGVGEEKAAAPAKEKYETRSTEKVASKGRSIDEAFGDLTADDA